MIPLLLDRPNSTPGAAVPPPAETWAARSDVPAAINPAGTLWLVEREWTFDGPAGSPPPAPWRTGPRWAGGHPQLGGHVWRNQVNLAEMAYLDGTGNLVLKLDWNATHQTAVGAYLLTDHDGGVQLAEDYRVDPTADDGVYIEYSAALPADQPRASWCALWTYATVDPTFTPLTDTGLLAIYGGTSLSELEFLREEIDVMEHFGNHGPTFVDRFVSNFHGRHTSLCDDGALAAGYVKGEGFKPAWWGGTAANDGTFHTWGLMWTPRRTGSDGEQKLFYDGYHYLTRPAAGKVSHNQPAGLRLTWETEVYPDGASNPFGGGVVPPSTETSKFPREMKVARVRVMRRRLAAPVPAGWSIAPLSADKAEGNSGTTPFTFTVSRAGSTPAATVNYAVTSATASDSDFTGGVLPSGQMSFGAGVASQTLTINVSGDTTVETDEPFTVTLSNPSAGALVQATAIGTIRADDVASGGRDTSSPVLQDKGLSLLWHDLIGLTGGPKDSDNVYDPYTGSRTQNSDLGINLKRLSLGTIDGKPSLREDFYANQVIVLNYRSQYFPLNMRYREMGVTADVWLPSGFELINATTGNIFGKTVFGLLTGHEDFFRVSGGNMPTHIRQRGSIAYAEDMTGSEIGVNFSYDRGNGIMYYSFYCHIAGAYVNGQDAIRSYYNPLLGKRPDEMAYSHYPPGYVPQGSNPAIAKGRWVPVVLYGRMDTNRRDGIVELWVDGARKLWWPNIDLGGWVGNRNLYKGRSAPAAPAGTAENYQTQPFYSFGTGPLSNDCPSSYRTLGGFRFLGGFMRTMGGGVSTSPQHIPTSNQQAYFHNWRVYGRV